MAPTTESLCGSPRSVGWPLLAGLCLALGACDDVTPAALRASAAEPTADPQSPAAIDADVDARIVELRAQLEASLAREAGLRAELEAAELKRVAREREWMEYSSLLARVPPERLPGGEPFRVELEAQDSPAPSAPEVAPVDPRQAERSRELAQGLSLLLRLEQVRGLDLLECGDFSDDSIGPVVFRLLDGEGRLSGGLYAERLRLEGSRSARTLTLVLENGYEMSGGVRQAFADESPERPSTPTRRIVLEGVDPTRWVDSLGALFGEQGLDLSGDDGLWDLLAVRRALNDLLVLQKSAGHYRLRQLGGVSDGVLRDVHVERLDASGQVERRLFADRMRIARTNSGIELCLEQGVQVRGDDQRVPFLDGRFRILFPAADGAVWAAAGIPGLAEPVARSIDARR